MKFPAKSFKIQKDSINYAFNEEIAITIFKDALSIYTTYPKKQMDAFVTKCNDYLIKAPEAGSLESLPLSGNNDHLKRKNYQKSSSFFGVNQYMYMQYKGLIKSTHIVKACNMLVATNYITYEQKRKLLELIETNQNQIPIQISNLSKADSHSPSLPVGELLSQGFFKKTISSSSDKSKSISLIHFNLQQISSIKKQSNSESISQDFSFSSDIDPYGNLPELTDSKDDPLNSDNNSSSDSDFDYKIKNEDTCLSDSGEDSILDDSYGFKSR